MHPGILIIGVPISFVTGGYIGIAKGGSIIHCGVLKVGIDLMPTLKLGISSII